MRRFFTFFLAVLGCCGSLYAQLANTTSLVGTVIDSAEAVIPGATVSAVNTATQDQYTAVSNAQGDYTIQFVKAGTYNITASHTGFQTITKGGIEVDYNQTVRSDFHFRSDRFPSILSSLPQRRPSAPTMQPLERRLGRARWRNFHSTAAMRCNSPR